MTDTRRSVALPAAAAGGLALKSLDDYFRLAEAFAATGLYGSAPTCLIKMLAGRELGFGAVASLIDVHLIPGGRDSVAKLTVGAHLRAAAIRQSGRYDYALHERTDQACEVEFLRRRPDGKEGWLSLGRLRYTLADAQAKGWTVTSAGTEKPTWKKTPANMLFARVMTDGYKTFTPDLSGGLLTYDADEFDVPAQERLVEPLPPAVNGPVEQSPTAPSSEDPGRLAPALPAPPPVERSPTAPSSGPGADVSTHAQRDRIAQLVTDLDLDWAAVHARMVQKYGVDRTALLTQAQAQEVITRLQAQAARRLASQSTSQATGEQP